MSLTKWRKSLESFPFGQIINLNLYSEYGTPEWTSRAVKFRADFGYSVHLRVSDRLVEQAIEREPNTAEELLDSCERVKKCKSTLLVFEDPKLTALVPCPSKEELDTFLEFMEKGGCRVNDLPRHPEKWLVPREKSALSSFLSSIFSWAGLG